MDCVFDTTDLTIRLQRPTVWTSQNSSQ